MRLDEAELSRWGRRMGETLSPPVVIGLRGPLGAGKSVLARAIGLGAGVTEPMPSPSYNLLLRYTTAAGLDVVHIDLYRIESPEELWELGWSQLGAEREIVMIEWPERAGDFMPRDRWEIELGVTSGHPDLRDIEVHRTGSPPDLCGFPMRLSV